MQIDGTVIKDIETETKKEMAEVFIDSLLTLKDNYSHMDNEFSYDIKNLIEEYEEYC